MPPHLTRASTIVLLIRRRPTLALLAVLYLSAGVAALAATPTAWACLFAAVLAGYVGLQWRLAARSLTD